MDRKTRFVAPTLLLIVSVLLIPFSAHAVLLQTESILANPASTENLWRYSYKSGYGGITSAYSYATSLSQYSDAALQGYVTALHTSNNYNYLNSGGIGDTRTVHVLSTYILSTVDQTVDLFQSGGDDGHSLFLDGGFIAGGGYNTQVPASINLVANTAYELEFVGYNYTGPWGWAFGFWDTAGSQWAGGIQTSANIFMDAEGDFTAVPEPTTILLLGTGLIGLAGTRRRHKK